MAITGGFAGAVFLTVEGAGCAINVNGQSKLEKTTAKRVFRRVDDMCAFRALKCSRTQISILRRQKAASKNGSEASISILMRCLKSRMDKRLSSITIGES
jgi:hypothetical protein